MYISLCVDFQLIRCTLKLLHVLYPKYEKLCGSQQGTSPAAKPESDPPADADKSAGEKAASKNQEEQAQDRDEESERDRESGSAGKTAGSKTPRDEAYQRKMMQMLYEVLQSQLVEIVALIAQVCSSCPCSPPCPPPQHPWIQCADHAQRTAGTHIAPTLSLANLHVDPTGDLFSLSAAREERGWTNAQNPGLPWNDVWTSTITVHALNYARRWAKR